jgi:hypothetical protein
LHFAPFFDRQVSQLSSPVRTFWIFRLSLRALLWTAIAQRLLDIIENHPAHLYVLANAEIGASKGLITRLLRIDIDYSKPLAHGHPINNVELPAGIEPIPEAGGAAETFPQDIYTEFNNDIVEPRRPGFWELLNAQKKRTQIHSTQRMISILKKTKHPKTADEKYSYLDRLCGRSRQQCP